MGVDGKNISSRYLVEFPREFRSREEFFEVIDGIAKISGSPLKVKLPSAEQVRNGQTECVLLGEKIAISVKAGAEPIQIRDSHITMGLPDSFLSKEWWISFDGLPHITVRINKQRGRPRKDLLRAKVQGQRAEEKSWGQIARNENFASKAAARHYR